MVVWRVGTTVVESASERVVSSVAAWVGAMVDDWEAAMAGK